MLAEDFGEGECGDFDGAVGAELFGEVEIEGTPFAFVLADVGGVPLVEVMPQERRVRRFWAMASLKRRLACATRRGLASTARTRKPLWR